MKAQNQTKPNTIIFVRRTVEWDGYELIDDEYTVIQPVMIIDNDTCKKHKRYIIDPKHKLLYIDLKVPKRVFRELLRARAVRNVGNKITVWDWDPEKAIPVLKKHGYRINEGWYKQYLANIQASRRAEKKVKEYEQKYGKHSYGVVNGVLWYLLNDSIIVYDGHTDKEYETSDYNIRDQLVEKYDPLNYVTR